MPEPRFLNLRDGGNLPRRKTSLLNIALICFALALVTGFAWDAGRIAISYYTDSQGAP